VAELADAQDLKSESRGDNLPTENELPQDKSTKTEYFKYGYRQAEIAKHTGLHYSTISRLISANKM